MGLSLAEGSRAHTASVAPSDQMTSVGHPEKGEKHAAPVCPALNDDDSDSVDNNEDDRKPLLQCEAASGDPGNSSSKPDTSGSLAIEQKMAGTVQQQRKGPRYLGVAYILLSSLAFSVMTCCVKYSTRYISSPEIVVWRASISWVLNYAIARQWKVDLRVDRRYRPLLLFRCCIGSFCISLHFFAMSMMSVTDSIVILFTSPVMTFILGAYFLKEPIERVEFVCALFSYVGVVFVAKPDLIFPSAALSDHHVPLIGTLAVLAAAFFQSCTQIAMRKLKPVHFVVITHWFGLFNLGLGLVTMLAFNIEFSGCTDWQLILALFLSGLSSCFGMLWLTLGFQLEKAGIASSLRYIDVVLAFIVDCAILGDSINTNSLFGGAVILTGAAVIAFRRFRSKGS